MFIFRIGTALYGSVQEYCTMFLMIHCSGLYLNYLYCTYTKCLPDFLSIILNKTDLHYFNPSASCAAGCSD